MFARQMPLLENQSIYALITESTEPPTQEECMNHAALRFARFALVATAVVLVNTIIFAQTDSGRITGMLTDQNGGLVPGASIVLKNDRTGEERTVTSGSDGSYSIASLKPSSYTITVTANGLGATANGIQILAGQEFRLNTTLQPSALNASVNVIAGAETFSTTYSASINLNANRQ